MPDCWNGLEAGGQLKPAKRRQTHWNRTNQMRSLMKMMEVLSLALTKHESTVALHLLATVI